MGIKTKSSDEQAGESQVSRPARESRIVQPRCGVQSWAQLRPRDAWMTALVGASDRKTIGEWDAWAAAQKAQEAGR